MIRALTRKEYAMLENEFPHYRGRWSYHSRVCDLATGLIDRLSLRTALELGPLWRSCIVNADVMDVRDVARLDPGATLVQHDAGRVPWPVQRKYDLFVALQVFEHLDADFATGRRRGELKGIQREAFREVARIARHAIVSLPIGWHDVPIEDCHYGITEEEALTWFSPHMPTLKVIGNGGARSRIIYVFEGVS